MFVDLHNMLMGRWFRYVVFKSYEARCEGRVLTGSEALRMIEDLLRDRDPHQVQALYARHSGYIDKVRDKLVRKSGLAASESAANEAAKPPPTLARCARLSEAYVEAFETAHTSYRLVLETVNLSNAMGAAKADLTGRKLMSAVGAIADFGALLSEALEVFARESRKKTLKVSAAGLGFVSGICDCFEFAMSTGEAAELVNADETAVA